MPNNYVLLERIELNASAASVTFANIPQTGYTDLKIVVSARSASASGDSSQTFSVSFNGLTTNRSQRQVFAYGTTPLSDSSASNIIGGVMNGTTGTASTFTNCEYYIPNYASNVAKSISLDKVNESNTATGNSLSLTAALWNSTAAITSITLTADSNTFAANSTFSLYGLAALGTTPAIAPKASGGNRIDSDGTYWYHTFLASGSFVPQTGLTCDVLVIAGGGGGGNQQAGGGGAGGLLAFTSQSLTATNYSITVGAGGAGSTNTARGVTGNDSQFGALTLVKGGGGGGSFSDPASGNNTGAAGGSGGGGGSAGQTNNTQAGGAATSGQGNAGGSGQLVAGTWRNGGGGGGAGGAGVNAAASSPTGTGGAGSSAYSSWATATSTGVSGSYAGGGGGGGNTAGTASAGGGAGATNIAGANGTVNTGGGGGGGGYSSFASGYAGGSGIVIIRYPIA